MTIWSWSQTGRTQMSPWRTCRSTLTWPCTTSSMRPWRFKFRLSRRGSTKYSLWTTWSPSHHLVSSLKTWSAGHRGTKRSGPASRNYKSTLFQHTVIIKSHLGISTCSASSQSLTRKAGEVSSSSWLGLPVCPMEDSQAWILSSPSCLKSQKSLRAPSRRLVKKSSIAVGT